MAEKVPLMPSHPHLVLRHLRRADHCLKRVLHPAMIERGETKWETE